MTTNRPSRFVITLPVGKKSDNLLALYHTLTEALIILTRQQWDSILSTGAERDTQTLNLLAAQGILVDKTVDEAVLFEQWRQRYVHSFSTLRSKVMVTRQCNNRCTYCIIDAEAGVMSAETAQRMDAFYFEQIERHQPGKVKDDYLGGEPLLNTDVVIESTGRRYYFCRGRGVDYRFSITTNGTLLSPQKVERLKAVGLSTVRVSMAGPAEVHDALRPLKNGSGTYAAIVANLEKVASSVDLLIECQYDANSDDYKKIPGMLADFDRRQITVVGIAFTPILARRRGDSTCGGMGDVDKYLFLMEQAHRFGIRAPVVPPSNACMTDFRAHFVFDTDGALIPCPSLQGGEMAYGSAIEGIDFVAEARMRERRWPDKCLHRCELLPVCMGGCRLQALTRNGDFNGVDCQYDTYRSLLEVYIRNKTGATLAKDKKAA